MGDELGKGKTIGGAIKDRIKHAWSNRGQSGPEGSPSLEQVGGSPTMAAGASTAQPTGATALMAAAPTPATPTAGQSAAPAPAADLTSTTTPTPS